MSWDVGPDDCDQGTVSFILFIYDDIKLDAGNNKQLFDEYLLAINKELSYVHFELRACRDQYDGQVCYGVVNNIADEQSKLGTKYSVPQIAFYKGIVSPNV